MQMLPDSMKEMSKWLWISPVQGVVLSKNYERKFRIIDLTILDADYLGDYLAELELSSTIMKIQEEKSSFETLIQNNKTFAVGTFSGSPEEHGDTWELSVRTELDILTASQLGYCSRESSVKIRPALEKDRAMTGTLLLNLREEHEGGFIFKKENVGLTLGLDGRWQTYCDNVFFSDLLSVMRGDTNIEGEWRKAFIRIAVLIGQGFGNTNPTHIFLSNFMALDTLLGNGDRQGKYDEVLVSRAESLLGWCKEWKEQNFPDKLKDIYSKRSNLVHSGKYSEINREDIEFLDDILRNVLCNLTKNPKEFPTRKSFHQYAERYEAAKTLGRPEDERLKTLKFFAKCK